MLLSSGSLLAEQLSEGGGAFPLPSTGSLGGRQSPREAPFLGSRVGGDGGPGSSGRRLPSPQGNLPLRLFLSLSLFPAPAVIHFPLPTMHFLLSFSKISPKSSFWIQGWSGFTVPSRYAPAPLPWPWARGGAHLFWPALSMTLETKLTMAEAGWLGSSSAKRWQALSVLLPCFRATKPKSFLSCGSRSQKVTVLRG